MRGYKGLFLFSSPQPSPAGEGAKPLCNSLYLYKKSCVYSCGAECGRVANPFGVDSESELIQWTQYAPAAFIQHMGINHCCGNIAMPQQFLHRADVIARFQQMRRKRMPQGMRRGRFGKPRGLHRFFHRPLQ